MSEKGNLPLMTDAHEFDKNPPEITWLGPVGGEQPDPKFWQGAITAKIDVLKARFNRDEAWVQQKLAELKGRVGEFFVGADPNAQVRCIDGRDEDEDTRIDNIGLGPQVAGGTPVSALTYRIARLGDMPGETIEDDLKTVAELVARLGLPYAPGGHEDSKSADSDDKTGCGAIDKMLDILALMNNREAMHAYSQAVIGEEEFSDRAFEEVMNEIAAFNKPARQKKYFTGGKQLLTTLKGLGRRNGKKSVERLKGEHNEIFLIINKSQGQTFNRDGFSTENDHLAQAFNYDYWHVVDRANALFPDDEGARQRLITSQVMYAVATAMALTDGSLELGIRQ